MNPNQPLQPLQSDNSLQTLIPYKNMPALLSYYFGVFGLIPLLGLPLSFAAVVFGFIGLKKSKLQPDTKGKAHAITGIILGFVELAVFLVFLALIIAS